MNKRLKQELVIQHCTDRHYHYTVGFPLKKINNKNNLKISGILIILEE